VLSRVFRSAKRTTPAETLLPVSMSSISWGFYPVQALQAIFGGN
jgi:hypothetical protein